MVTGAAKYGMPTLSAPAQPFVATAASNGSVNGQGRKKFTDPDNPELWLVGIGALTLGLIAVSTSVRVGPLHFAGSI